MTEMAATPIILNLAGELTEELSSYFVLKNFRIVDPLKENAVLSWTHILVKDVEDFDVVGDTYGTLDHDIKIVALSQPRDLKNFMMNNGKLVLDESWLKGPFGAFILDKFFQEYGGVNLGDNYPKFRENGSFNITNPFNTGEYLDHLVYNAFESGMSALSIKTYFDHLLMYLTSLKNKGRVGFPVEVSYGTYSDVYGLQMHFYSGNMQIEDVTNSLTSSITKTPEEYLLYIALQSADFFDFTYIPEVKKVVITGLWNKDENVKTTNKGLMFTVSSAENVKAMPATEPAGPFVLNEGTIEDLSSMVSPAGEGDVQIIPAELPSVEEVQVISGSEPEEEEVRIIPAYKVEEEQATVVSGGTQEKEAVTNVKGEKEEQDKTVTKIAGKKEEKDNFKVTLSNTKEEKKGNLTVRSLGGGDVKGPGMFDFAEKGTTELGNGEGTGNKKAAALFKVGGTSKREEELDKKLSQVLGQNDELKSKLVTVMNELKAQKETQARLRKAAEDAANAAVVDNAPSKLDEILRNTPAKAPNDRETKMAEEFRQMEKTARRMQLEASQKELRLGQEMEKLQRMVALKDTAIEKTRESMNKVMEKKNEEIQSLQMKLEQVNKHMAGGGAQAQTTAIKELERQTLNQNKMIEMYKNKITNLSAALEATKVDENSKDDARKLQLNNDQLKTQAEMLRKEIAKLQERSSSDQTQILTLKQEKGKLTESLKKAEQAAKAQQHAAAGANSEVEVKRLQTQVQLLETYLKEANTKVRDLEIKLQNATAVSRTGTTAEDGQSKVKITHLENSVKKLTQDLVESRNQQAELKKETNKLRQEKTALQNTLDKAKKDMEKFEKKPASGKKAS